MSKFDLILSRLEDIKTLAGLSAKNALVIEDVVLLTGLSKAYLYTLTSTKQIPHYKLGNKVYFNKSEIEQWMLSNKVETVAESEQRAMAHCL